MKQYLSINVTGKVQGVYFRASTKLKADELNLKGTVMNLSNGSVQIEVVGEKESLQKFIDWCHEGPEQAEVLAVEYSQREENVTYTEFGIIRNK